MTPTQTAILAFLREHPRASYREIVAGCALSSTSVAAYNLGVLERLGLVRAGGFGKARQAEAVGADPLRDAVAAALGAAQPCECGVVVPAELWGVLRALV